MATWLQGIFTPRLHAVADPTPRLVFRSVPVVWSLCGAPAELAPPPGDLPTCALCLYQMDRNGGSGRGSGDGTQRPSTSA
ncbi:MAG TPA: hypothetical protein VFV67_27940 [Actinophytocola sp.]|uniref:hypothetical protein n=1 Tax=Actinophytocola sp. TaxID=1872138 RepID=UPI002DB930C0|nr:hypothetical protein [Actinophytocola sp.]HEU5474495.1 hypothetical protein [Actinophytocola sp.]